MSGKTARAARRATTAAATKPRPVQAPKRREEPTSRRTRLAIWALVAVAAGIAAIYGVVQLTSARGNEAAPSVGAPSAGNEYRGTSEYPYDVGAPGPGEPAPPVKLVSTKGGPLDLAAYRGKEQVLLYFQEGLMCQPCWDQMVAIEQELPKFKRLGVDRMVSITGDPLHLLEQKVADEGIRSPVLSDSTYEVSDSYDARTYGMMNGQMAGHSFVLVGKDGKIIWRADYGGAPNYFMFVPVDVLLTDLKRGSERAA